MNEKIYRTYLLTILAVVLAFNGVDGLALGLVLQDIKVDLSLSDTQLGFLTGIAFALFHSIVGIPISRWADRGNRVTIISLATAMWSAAVALCGFVGSFAQLLLIRIVVGVGEAGCLPSALSLIADYFSRAERARAVSIYLQGGSLSIVMGYFVGGWLNQFYGWRVMFILLGLPGLGLATLSWFTLREPRRSGAFVGSAREAVPKPEFGAEPSTQPTLSEVCATLWANRTFRQLLLFYSVSGFFNVAILQWQPAFFVRSYGLKTGELGTWITAIYGLGGMAGLYLGGEWASRHASKNEPLQFRAMAITYCCVALVASCIYLSPNRYLAFGFMALMLLATAATGGPLFATVQTLVPERMRATAFTILMLFPNLLGRGLAPLATGALSDALRPVAGEESLRYALLVLCPGYLWCAWYLWRASATVTQDLETVNGDPRHVDEAHVCYSGRAK